MPRQVLLLRGINLGSTRRVPMAELRALLGEGGFEEVATYVQSGNVVLSSSLTPEEVASKTERMMASRFGFEIPVVVRTREELATVVEANPLREVATDPKRYQVSFFDRPLPDEVATRLLGALAEPEALVIDGREAYAWHPNGVARSKMWNALAGSGLGVKATARNWTTVLKLLKMACT